ncbi:4-hydroxy-4-methyl-2-oxoglutarate aldolase [Rhizobiales bacterium GAS113]|nr:4-hydroxy-4-methyl-2-oxoglutarate aldolase [Rhizobiales bacterium GAS113]
MIVDPPLLTVRRHFPRPDASSLSALAGAQTGHLVDAMEGRGGLDAAIKPIDPQSAGFVGTALTCETGPSDNLAIMGALAIAEPGDVIVAASDGFAGTAVIGDNVAMMAKNRGVVALVTDGMARDRPGIVAAGLPVFARGVTPNSCMRSGPGRIGLPILCGGVAIDAGDVIVGDVDGVVVVPRGMLDRVIKRLAEVIEAERALQARIAGGLGVLDAIEALMRSDRVRYLD